MSATLITISHTFKNPDQTAASGVIGFRLSARMTNGSTTYADEVPVHATLNGSGVLSQVLPANNDPGTTPANSTYIVTFMLNGASGVSLSGDEYSIVVPYNAPGGTVDLGTLLPVQVGL
jgi:hypothetical protein